MGGSSSTSYSSTTIIHEANLSQVIVEHMREMRLLEKELAELQKKLTPEHRDLEVAKLTLETKKKLQELEAFMLAHIEARLKILRTSDQLERQYHMELSGNAPDNASKVAYLEKIDSMKVHYPSTLEVYKVLISSDLGQPAKPVNSQK